MGTVSSSRHSRSDAIIIVVCGKAGAGKSTFINIATRSSTLPVNHSHSVACPDVLHVTVEELAHVRFKDNIIFLEVPSLVSLEPKEESSVEQSLQKLLESLREQFKYIRICGFLYLHPVTDPDFPDSRARYWALLMRLWRRRFLDALPGRMVLVTTKWACSQTQLYSRKRQRELRNYWQKLPREPVSSTVMSFHEFFERAWLIVAASMAIRDGDILRRMMVKEGKRQEWERWEEAESKWEWQQERQQEAEKNIAREGGGRRTDKGKAKEGQAGTLSKGVGNDEGTGLSGPSREWTNEQHPSEGEGERETKLPSTLSRDNQTLDDTVHQKSPAC